MINKERINTVEQLKNVTRVEVIDENGRSYVKTGADYVEYSLQDNGSTLKIFVTKIDKKN